MKKVYCKHWDGDSCRSAADDTNCPKGFRYVDIGDKYHIDVEDVSIAEEELSKYIRIGNEIGNLVEEKQKAYGNSFGKTGNVLKEMYPDGIIVEQYDDMLCIVRILDKLFRIATKKDALGESPYRDVAGYGILGVAKDETK